VIRHLRRFDICDLRVKVSGVPFRVLIFISFGDEIGRIGSNVKRFHAR
jgi:hypothetical protein